MYTPNGRYQAVATGRKSVGDAGRGPVPRHAVLCGRDQSLLEAAASSAVSFALSLIWLAELVLPLP